MLILVMISITPTSQEHLYTVLSSHIIFKLTLILLTYQLKSFWFYCPLLTHILILKGVYLPSYLLIVEHSLGALFSHCIILLHLYKLQIVSFLRHTHSVLTSFNGAVSPLLTFLSVLLSPYN